MRERVGSSGNDLPSSTAGGEPELAGRLISNAAHAETLASYREMAGRRRCDQRASPARDREGGQKEGRCATLFFCCSPLSPARAHDKPPFLIPHSRGASPFQYHGFSHLTAGGEDGLHGED